MGDGYPGKEPQTDEDGSRTEDCPIDANEQGTKVPVAVGGDYLLFVHCGGKHDLTNAATWESGTIAWGCVTLSQTGKGVGGGVRMTAV